MPVVRQRLAEKGIKFIEAHVEEAGMLVTQVLPNVVSRGYGVSLLQNQRPTTHSSEAAC